MARGCQFAEESARHVLVVVLASVQNFLRRALGKSVSDGPRQSCGFDYLGPRPDDGEDVEHGGMGGVNCQKCKYPLFF